MAIAQKYSVDATTKTHGTVDATVMDLVLPTTPLDGTGNVIRSAIYALGGWVGRGYKENRSFGL